MMFGAKERCDVVAFEGVKRASMRGKKGVKTTFPSGDTVENGSFLVGEFLHGKFLNSYKRISLSGIDYFSPGYYIRTT